MTTIVGLDLSLSSSGCARLSHSDPPLHLKPVGVFLGWVGDTWHRPSSGHRGDTMRERHERIAHIAADVLSYAEPCDLVVVEQPAFSQRGGSAHDRSYLWWRIVGRLLDHDVPVIEVAPNTAKKWVANDGRADKAVVASRITKMWDWASDIRKEDEFDALVMASIGCQLLGLPVPFDLPKYRVDAIATLRLPSEEAA